MTTPDAWRGSCVYEYQQIHFEGQHDSFTDRDRRGTGFREASRGQMIILIILTGGTGPGQAMSDNRFVTT